MRAPKLGGCQGRDDRELRLGVYCGASHLWKPPHRPLRSRTTMIKCMIASNVSHHVSNVVLVVEPSKIIFLILYTIPQKEDIIFRYLGTIVSPNKMLLMWQRQMQHECN